MTRKKKYSKEFKLDAVNLVLEQNYTKATAARSLEVNPNILGRWVNEFKEDDGHAFRGNGKLTPEQLELRQEYPEKPFADISAARIWVGGFVQWYNNAHRHQGENISLLINRKHVYEKAKLANPSDGVVILKIGNTLNELILIQKSVNQRAKKIRWHKVNFRRQLG